MLKIAHLILAHKNPEQLSRMIDAMQHPAFDFYIHIDKKTDASSFYKLAERENIYFIKKRTKIFWAGFGTIQATINGFTEIPLDNYAYINVISAQDFPLKPADDIYQYLIERKGTEFITCDSIKDKWLDGAPHVHRYHLINWRFPGKYRLENLLNKILPPRKFPLDIKEFVGRANWFTLTPDAIRYCMKYLHDNPKVIRYYKYSWGADEFIFSTALYHSSFKDRITDNLIYTDWSEGKANPKILKREDLPGLLSTDKLFARKFDTTIDEEIIFQLEQHLKQKK